MNRILQPLIRAIAVAGVLAFAVSACATPGASPGGGPGNPTGPSEPDTAGATSPVPTPRATAPAPTPAPPSASEPGTATPAAGSIELTVELSADGAEYLMTYTISCEGGNPLASMDHPDPQAACRVLAERGGQVLFEVPDPNRACTQQYGGPQRARVTGTFNDRPVDTTFSRTDGCEISRWESLEAVFGSVGGAL